MFLAEAYQGARPPVLKARLWRDVADGHRPAGYALDSGRRKKVSGLVPFRIRPIYRLRNRRTNADQPPGATKVDSSRPAQNPATSAIQVGSAPNSKANSS